MIQSAVPRRSSRVSWARAGRSAAIAVAMSAFLPLVPAAAQGTEGSFPSPRGGAEIDAWLDDAGVPEAGRDAIFEIHARYLAEVERLRDGEVEAWMRAKPNAWMNSLDVAQMQAKVEQSLARIEQQRRLAARFDAMEERLWAEIGSTTQVPDDVLGSLRDRGSLRRLSDLGGVASRRHFSQAQAADVAALIAAAKATPAEAARIREALAGHDRTLVKLLEEDRDLALGRERRQASRQLRMAESMAETQRFVQEEMDAAREENREPRAQEIYEARNAEINGFDGGEQEIGQLNARLTRLQLAAVRAIEPIVGDPLRTARVLSAAGVGYDGMDEFFGMFEEMGREGELSPAKIEALADLKARSVAANLPQRMEIAELMARRQELPNGGWGQLPDGTYGQSPEAEEIDQRMMELQGGESQQQQMQMVVEIGRLIGSKTFADVMRKWGRKQGMPEAMLEPMIAQLVAGIEAGAIDAEAMQKEFMRSMWSAPPTWKVIDEPMLEAILDDLAVEGEMRLVAKQLIEDGAPRFAAAIEETSAETALPEDLDPEAMFMQRMGGAGAEQIAAFDAGLRRVLAADEAFFDDLVGVLGEQVAEPLRPWRAVRRAQLIGACDAGMGGGMARFFWMYPSIGQFDSIDLFVVAQEAIPEAMRNPAARAAFAAQAERIAALQGDRWRALSALQPEHAKLIADSMATQQAFQTAMDRDQPIGEAESQRQRENQARMQELEQQLERWRKAVPEAIREDLARLQAVLDAESASAFRRAVLLEAWGRELGELKAREAIDAAQAKAERSGDAARLAELDAIEASYDDATGRLLELLWKTSQEIREQGSPGDVEFEEGVVPIDTSTWWPSASGRAKFRLGELEFATMREMGES